LADLVEWYDQTIRSGEFIVGRSRLTYFSTAIL